MAEIAGVVLSAVACVAQCFSPSGGHRINRWCEFKSDFKILKANLKTLKAERISIQRRVNLAKKNGDGIEENVQSWLERAEEIEVEIRKWLERAKKIIGGDHEAGKARKDEETAATGEIGGDAEIVAQQQGEIREDIQAAAPAGREIGGGEETVAAAGKLRADEEKTVTKKGCVRGLCPNWKLRDQLSKEAEKLLEDVVEHLEAGKFDKISYTVIPKDLRLSIKDYLDFESRASTLNDVIKSLRDPEFNIVGIHGMGGIGKTTLAKKVANQLEASKLFDSVIFVEVTERPDITKIQKEIAEKLPGLTFLQEETESRRAANLYRRLENEKNILIILDNIWAETNLQEIGISLGDGRKLLLTARNVDVLAKMESQQNFPVKLLDDEEAWQLFKEMSRDNIEGTEFESIAKEVAEKCARLPIVIVTVARALRGKELFTWRNASRQMGLFSSADIPHIHASIRDGKTDIHIRLFADIHPFLADINLRNRIRIRIWIWINISATDTDRIRI